MVELNRESNRALKPGIDNPWRRAGRAPLRELVGPLRELEGPLRELEGPERASEGAGRASEGAVKALA